MGKITYFVSFAYEDKTKTRISNTSVTVEMPIQNVIPAVEKKIETDLKLKNVKIIQWIQY